MLDNSVQPLREELSKSSGVSKDFVLPIFTSKLHGSDKLDCEEVLGPSEHVIRLLNLCWYFVCFVGIYT